MKLVRTFEAIGTGVLLLCAAPGCNVDARLTDASASETNAGMKPRAAPPRVDAFGRRGTGAAVGTGTPATEGSAGSGGTGTAGSNSARSGTAGSGSGTAGSGSGTAGSNSAGAGTAGDENVSASMSVDLAGASAMNSESDAPTDASTPATAPHQPADDMRDASGDAGAVDSVSSANEEPGVLWVGRVEPLGPDVARFAWQGAGLIANVEGRELAVELRTESNSTIFYIALIDGDEVLRFGVDGESEQEVTLAADLDPGTHRVELYRDTESKYGVSEFLGFTRGALRGAPARSARLIEVVGDSISAGYGNLGYELHPNAQPDPACRGTEQNSSWYDSYAAVAGREFHAEVSTIARAGWGMSRDAEGDSNNVMPALWEHVFGDPASRAWSFESKAGAVVINLGTNDYKQGDPGEDFQLAYARFLERVRAAYPDAWIFLTLGSMLGQPDADQCMQRMQRVMDDRVASGDDKLQLVDFGIQSYGDDGLTPTGCNWHPNQQEHQRMASLLARELAAKLAW